MPLLVNITALLAAIAPALAISPLSDSYYTETIGPQEIGSTALYGTMVYSMNYCTVVHNTECSTSLSTAEHPPSSTEHSSYTPPLPTYGQPSETITTTTWVPVPTPSTVEVPPPATTTSFSTHNVPGDHTTTTLITEEGSSSYTPTHTSEVPTGAAAMGAAAVMGNVFVAALAALAV